MGEESGRERVCGGEASEARDKLLFYQSGSIGTHHIGRSESCRGRRSTLTCLSAGEESGVSVGSCRAGSSSWTSRFFGQARKWWNVGPFAVTGERGIRCKGDHQQTSGPRAFNQHRELLRPPPGAGVGSLKKHARQDPELPPPILAKWVALQKL
mgnify:CR=1 FL=1